MLFGRIRRAFPALALIAAPLLPVLRKKTMRTCMVPFRSRVPLVVPLALIAAMLRKQEEGILHLFLQVKGAILMHVRRRVVDMPRKAMPPIDPDAPRQSKPPAAAVSTMCRTAKKSKQSESLSNEIRKRFRTAKADREFDRTIGARERARARMEEQERGSRAAVYDMHMGASQRKSVRAMAEGDKKRSKGFSLPFALPFNGSLSAWATRTVVAFVAVAFAVVMLYPSCQNYYNETRQLQQLQAEYDALQEYNTQMQNQVDYLNTDAGIEDYARSELGWIRPGEHVVSVEGVTSSTDSTRSNSRVYSIPAGSVAAPDTWYSGILDVIFGYGH